MKIIKILAVLLTGALSLFTAIHFTKEYVQEVAEKEKSLAEAIINAQFEAELKKAEEEAEKELGEALITTSLVTKAPETTTTTTATTTTTTTTTTTHTKMPETSSSAQSEEETPEEIITEFSRGGLLPADRTNVPIMTMFTLSTDEQTRVTRFLIDHYFLDGTVYVEKENRPYLKERKMLGLNMETGAIQSLNLVLGSLNFSDISAMMNVDYNALKDEVIAKRDEFREEYKNAGENGEVFSKLYESTLRYYDRLIIALGNFGATAENYKNSTNPILAMGLLADALNNVIIPEILGVLEESFDLIEASHDIFLEGTQGTVLLTREEVTAIVINPGLVLGTGLA